MTMTPLYDFVLSHPHRLAMPVLSFPGAPLAGATVRRMVTDAATQTAVQHALHARFSTSFVMSAMDLSVEAEEFGATIRMEEDEIPTVTGRLVTDRTGVDALRVPAVGTRRSRVYLETVRRLASVPGRAHVLAGMIGPFSLAGRLFGVSEVLLETAGDTELLHALIEKATTFLLQYAAAFREAGADGIIIAEPTAGLISPSGTAEFSSAYVRRIVEAVRSERFEVILHNCGARLQHLPAVLESGARIFHFGRPMDLPAALASVPAETVLCGNLDPAEVFVQSTPAEVDQRVRGLLGAVGGRKNFILSSGCDVPPNAPLENVAAFFAAARPLPA
jgi:uroporphyrinogen decarboxylase